MHDGVYVLPAYAGMILAFSLLSRVFSGAPRVCGDDPSSAMVPGTSVVCSPRMRG